MKNSDYNFLNISKKYEMVKFEFTLSILWEV